MRAGKIELFGGCLFGWFKGSKTVAWGLLIKGVRNEGG